MGVVRIKTLTAGQRNSDTMSRTESFELLEEDPYTVNVNILNCKSAK